MQQLRAIGLAMALLALTDLAQAMMIVVEPDDYAPGTDLSTVSSYVTLSNGRHSPVFSGTFSCPGYSAPTGTRVFSESGASACNGWASQGGGPFPEGDGGFAFVATFNQAVTDIGLSVLNFGYPLKFGASYALYDELFQRIDYGFIDTPLGQQMNLSFLQTGIRYLEIGGFDSIAALSIDRLSFRIPEPASWGLFALGSVLLVVIGRRRGRAQRPTLHSK